MLTFNNTKATQPKISTKQHAVNNPSIKLVDILVVSMARLIGYGINETRRRVQKMMAHREFRNYECGNIFRSQFIENIGPKFKLTSSEVDKLLLSIIECCVLDEELIRLSLDCSNDLVLLLDIPDTELSYIENTKPELLKTFKGFRKVTLDKIQPSQVVISKDPEVASIHRSMGIISIPYSLARIEYIEGYLRTLNPSACYQRGLMAFDKVLESYRLQSIIEMDLLSSSELDKPLDVGVIEEYFNPLLISWYCPDVLSPELESKLVEMVKGGPFGYFGTEFNRLPADVDTMSVNIATLYGRGSITYEDGYRAMDLVLANQVNDVIQVYFDIDRPRIDHVVLCNVLYACYNLGLESSPLVRKNEKLVHNYFLNDGHEFGTKYYHTPETFLFHFGRMLSKFQHRIPNYNKLRTKFVASLAGRMGLPATSLDISKRVILSHMLSLPNYADPPLLLSLQGRDGTWPPSDLYLLPTTKGRVYNPAVDMCFCLHALRLSFPS